MSKQLNHRNNRQQQQQQNEHQPHVLPLIKYDQSPAHDIMLAGAYKEMVDTGDIFNVIPQGSISALLFSLAPPSEAYFKCSDDGRIWFLGWFEQNYILGRLLAIWGAPEKRQTKEGFAAVLELINRGLDDYGEILAVTTQPKVVESSIRLGYTVVGKLEGMLNRDDRWILHVQRRELS